MQPSFSWSMESCILQTKGFATAACTKAGTGATGRLSLLRCGCLGFRVQLSILMQMMLSVELTQTRGHGRNIDCEIV